MTEAKSLPDHRVQYLYTYAATAPTIAQLEALYQQVRADNIRPEALWDEAKEKGDSKGDSQE